MDLSKNGFVAAMSKGDQRLLRSCCEPMVLKANCLLAPAPSGEFAYFIVGTSVALLRDFGSDRLVAVGLVGQEGALGLQFALGLGPSGHRMLVQTDGSAWRISGKVLRRLAAGHPSILMAIARYLWLSSMDQGALATSAQHQPVLQRLSNWILRSRDADSAESLRLTHAHLAQMLGVRRASISVAAKELSDHGLLRYARGQIWVLDRPRLVLASRHGVGPAKS